MPWGWGEVAGVPRGVLVSPPTCRGQLPAAGAQCVGDRVVLGAQVLLLLHAWGAAAGGVMGHPWPPQRVTWRN